MKYLATVFDYYADSAQNFSNYEAYFENLQVEPDYFVEPSRFQYWCRAFYFLNFDIEFTADLCLNLVSQCHLNIILVNFMSLNGCVQQLFKFIAAVIANSFACYFGLAYSSCDQ